MIRVVAVGVISSPTKAGTLDAVKREPSALRLRNSNNAPRWIPARSASTVISASDWVAAPSSTLWQIFATNAASPSPDVRHPRAEVL